MSQRERHCRCCGTITTGSYKEVAERLFQAGLTDNDVLNAQPICLSCAEIKYVRPSIGKYHDDPNINAVCLWCESREYDRQAVRIEDEGPTWMVRFKTFAQRLPKGSIQSMGVGSIFARLDHLSQPEKLAT